VVVFYKDEGIIGIMCYLVEVRNVLPSPTVDVNVLVQSLNDLNLEHSSLVPLFIVKDIFYRP